MIMHGAVNYSGIIEQTGVEGAASVLWCGVAHPWYLVWSANNSCQGASR